MRIVNSPCYKNNLEAPSFFIDYMGETVDTVEKPNQPASIEVREKLWTLFLKKVEDELAIDNNKAKLAEKIGISRPALSKYIKGSRGKGTDQETIGRYLLKLGVTMEEIFTYLEPEEALPVLSFMSEDNHRFAAFAKILRKGGVRKKLLFDALDSLSDGIDDKENDND